MFKCLSLKRDALSGSICNGRVADPLMEENYSASIAAAAAIAGQLAAEETE